jgi:hypothetical protein
MRYLTRGGDFSHGSLLPTTSERIKVTVMKTTIIIVAVFLVGHILAWPTGPVPSYARDSAASLAGIEVMSQPLVIKLIQTLLAIISVTLTVLIYGLLIRRASLMSTASMYPCRPIEANLSELLTRGWPSSSLRVPSLDNSLQKVRLSMAIQCRNITNVLSG